MSQKNIIRAWKDEEYRNSLSEAELAALPANPAGLVEVSDEDLDAMTGGTYTTGCTQWSRLTAPRLCCC
ncbi:MAG TPA: mersacidin/lichenicidin family type 2 lantibiotic [Thermoanaerobaculia bacterium]|nr:mersacidin/lichenicidin family type 2 lantibiotic [Thermoanaerobaculia bacterium]